MRKYFKDMSSDSIVLSALTTSWQCLHLNQSHIALFVGRIGDAHQLDL